MQEDGRVRKRKASDVEGPTDVPRPATAPQQPPSSSHGSSVSTGALPVSPAGSGSVPEAPRLERITVPFFR